MCNGGEKGLSHRGIDVRAIRKRLRFSQKDFAIRFGLLIDDIRAWEKGDKRPTGCARVLLIVIAREPKAVMRATR